MAELSLSSIFLHCIQNRWLWLDFPEALELDRRGVEKQFHIQKSGNVESISKVRMYIDFITSLLISFIIFIPHFSVKDMSL